MTCIGRFKEIPSITEEDAWHNYLQSDNRQHWTTAPKINVTQSRYELEVINYLKDINNNNYFFRENYPTSVVNNDNIMHL